MNSNAKSTFVLLACAMSACAVSRPEPDVTLRLLGSTATGNASTPPPVPSGEPVKSNKPADEQHSSPSVVSQETLQMPASASVLVYNDTGPQLAGDGDSTDDSGEVEVEEPGMQPAPAETEAVAEDSTKSPEEIAQIVPREGPVEAHFALCDDSVYMRQWQRDFDQIWLQENSKRYRKIKERNRALVAARSEAFVKLVVPTMSSFESDYPTVVNRDVLLWLQYFQTRGRKAMVTWLKRGEDVIPVAQPILEKYGLPKDLIYLSMIESGFSNRAKSIANAVGPWQFIRSTGKLYKLRIDDFVDERRDPLQSTHAAARFLSDLYASLGDWHLAAASYNAGEGRIQRALRSMPADQSDFFSLSEARRLPNETRNYVPKLIAALFIGKYPAVFGFEVAQGSRALHTRIVPVARSVALDDLARESNMDPKLLEDLNPELRVGITPPPTASRPSFPLKVPESMADKMVALVETVPEASIYRVVSGRVGRKESAARFASRLGLSMADFLKANPKLGSKSVLLKGQEVMFPVRLGSGQYEKLTALSAEKKSSRARGKLAASKKRFKGKSKAAVKTSYLKGGNRKSSMKNTKSRPGG